VVSGQWSVVSGQWSVVSGQWLVVSGQWSVVSGQWSVRSQISNPRSLTPVEYVYKHTCFPILKIAESVAYFQENSWRISDFEFQVQERQGVGEIKKIPIDQELPIDCSYRRRKKNWGL
jgi:hypothetical protein